MFSITDFGFWLSLVAIAASILLAFYIPGRTVLGRTKIIEGGAVHVVAFVLGITLWAWQGYIFGTLHLRWLSYIYLLIFVFLFFKGRYINLRKLTLKPLFSTDPILLFLGAVGIFAQTFQYYDYGLRTAKGIVITAHNPNDHIWHAALVQELVTRFPPNEPGISGVALKNYHYWFNLVTAELVRVFHLPLLQTQFIGMYVLAAVLLAFVSYFLGKAVYDNKMFLRLLYFFIFFAGDASMWVAFAIHHKLSFFIDSIINNSVKFVDSPPYAYSIIVGLVGFYLLFLFKSKLPKRYILIIALMFGSLLEFKVYTGITFLLGFGALALYSFIKKRYSIVLAFILAGALGALTFFPNITSTSGLSFVPFNTPRDFLTQSAFGLLNWQLRWDIYFVHHNYIRLYQYGIYMTVVYFIAQFGLQLIGLLPYKKMRVIIGWNKLIPLYVVVFSGFIIGVLFFQNVGGANIWEFFLPAGLILSFFTALSISLILENRSKVTVALVTILIVAVVIPRWLLTVTSQVKDEYLSGFHGINNLQYAAYQYFTCNANSPYVILSLNEPYTGIVTPGKMLTGCDFYMSGTANSQLVTAEMARRLQVVAKIKKGYLADEIPLLKKDKIKYLYINGSASFLPSPQTLYKVVFHNSAASIITLQ